MHFKKNIKFIIFIIFEIEKNTGLSTKKKMARVLHEDYTRVDCDGCRHYCWEY